MTTAALTVGLVLVLGAAWLRAAGSAVARIPRADALRDASDGVKGADEVAALLDDRETISSAVGVVAAALLVMGAALGAAFLAGGLTSSSALLVALGAGLLVFLLGELIPRRLGMINPRFTAYHSHRLLRAAVRLGGWANELIPEMEGAEDEPHVVEEEEAEDQERELIDSVLEFSETIVREVMTPRPDMVTIPVTGSIEKLIGVSAEEGFSRIPVTSDGDVVGMVIVKDLLTMLTDEQVRPRSVAEVMRPVEFVPETKLAAALLGEMQESHLHQAIVVDEYGEVSGLVTIEDLLEELVGEIADETDVEEDLIYRRGDGWWVDARLGVDDFCKVVGVELGEYEGDTVGGLVLGLAERIPEEGEVFGFERLAIEVIRMQGRRVAEVVVTASERIDST